LYFQTKLIDCALHHKLLVVVFARFRQGGVFRQGQRTFLQDFLQAAFRVLEVAFRVNFFQPGPQGGEDELAGGFISLVNQYRAKQGFHGIGQHRRPVESPRLQLATAQNQ